MHFLVDFFRKCYGKLLKFEISMIIDSVISAKGLICMIEINISMYPNHTYRNRYTRNLDRY